MSIVSVNYKKHGEPSALEQRETVKECVAFIKRLDPKTLEYVSLTDGFGHQTIGYDKISTVYKKNDDLYGGSKQCIHPETVCGSGGGISCPTCKAWFCY